MNNPLYFPLYFNVYDYMSLGFIIVYGYNVSPSIYIVLY